MCMLACVFAYVCGVGSGSGVYVSMSVFPVLLSVGCVG